MSHISSLYKSTEMKTRTRRLSSPPTSEAGWGDGNQEKNVPDLSNEALRVWILHCWLYLSKDASNTPIRLLITAF